MKVICVENRKTGPVDFCFKSARRAGVDFVVLDGVSPAGLNELSDIYIHASPNSREFEIICMRRYLILRDYLIDNPGVKNFMLIDSDTLIYKDIHHVLHKRNGEIFSGSYISKERDARRQISPHASVWSRVALFDFVDYVFEFYKNPGAAIKIKEITGYFDENKISGGVSDMTLLYLWANDRGYLDPINIIEDKITIDHNITTTSNLFDNEFDGIFGFKKITINEDRVTGVSGGDNISFAVLHFQGQAKKLMSCVYNGNYIGYIIWTIVIFLARKYKKVKNAI